jgi:nitroreductase
MTLKDNPMSTVLETIQKRYSVRSFKDTPVDRKIILSITEAARLAPSACNAQPGRFIAVTEKSLLKDIVHNGLGGVVPNRWAVSAPVIIVGCTKLNLLTHRVAEAAKGIHYHQIDLGIAMEHMVLRATELGLGTCWIGWFKAKQIKKTLQIPHDWKIISLLALGYPQEVSTAPTPRLDLEKILFFNKMT